MATATIRPKSWAPRETLGSQAPASIPEVFPKPEFAPPIWERRADRGARINLYARMAFVTCVIGMVSLMAMTFYELIASLLR